MKTTLGILMLGLFLAVATGSAGDGLDRTKKPVGKAAPTVQLPQIQKATLMTMKKEIA